MAKVVTILHVLMILIKFLLVLFQKKDIQSNDDYDNEFSFAAEF